MSYPRVQFVSAPSLDADVRFDCNSVGEWSDDDRWPEHDGFSLGFPSLSGDPEAIGVQYGTREIEFNLIVRATPDAAFGVFSRLSREVQRSRNWLMVQFSDFSKPVWFYTYRTEQQALDFQNVSGIDDTKRNVWGIGVRLAADPFAQGERVTLDPVTVNNRQFGGTANSWHMTLPAILGDAPVPVQLRVKTSTDWSGDTPMVSSIALDGGPYDGSPIVCSAQGATAGTDVGAWSVNGAFPTNGFVPVSFATATGMATRLTDSTTVLPVGTYRVLAFVSRGDPSTTYRLQGTHARGGLVITGDPVDFDRAPDPTGGQKGWVDLGLFTFPAFASMDDQSSVYTQTASFQLKVQRLTGPGGLSIGALLYVPVETPWSQDSRTFFAEFGATGLAATTQTAEWNEDGGYAVLVTSALPVRSISDATPPKPTGGLPLVLPGCTNTVTLLQQTNIHTPADPSKDNRDDVNATATVTLSYAPRYLHLAGSETL